LIGTTNFRLISQSRTNVNMQNDFMFVGLKRHYDSLFGMKDLLTAS